MELELAFKESDGIQYASQKHNEFIIVYKEVEKAAGRYLDLH